MAKHPQQITTADTALDDDMKSRIIKYSITMGIRTLCFVAAYFAFVASQHVLMWICVAGAVLLPYPAVIFANAGRERSRDDRSALIDSAPLDQLPPGRGETISGDTLGGEPGDATAKDSGTGRTPRGETIPGETVDPETDTPGTGGAGTDPGTASAGPSAQRSPRTSSPRMTESEHHFTADSNGEIVEDDEESAGGRR
ncbi:MULTISPECIES: DUF3099 domain-containing protein [Brevibacterium]|uniref:DUF3099 domain-containing protein n=1 Tax=Brevibacterium TaxID=1696 RepID=UPI001BAD10D8|nr:DUF3099 domain-containing protein [Brevibacterium sp. W7.2]